MAVLETEMKEIGRTTWNNTRSLIADPYISSMSQTSLQTKETFRVKEYKYTHARARTHKNSMISIHSINSSALLLKVKL